MALFAPDAIDGTNGRGLRGGKKDASSSSNSTTVLLDGLAIGAIYGYFTTLRFPGNQVCICDDGVLYMYIF